MVNFVRTMGGSISLGLAMLLLVSIGTNFAILAEKLTEQQKKLLSDSGWYEIKDYSGKVYKFKNLTDKISVKDVKMLETTLNGLMYEYNNFKKNASKVGPIKKASDKVVFLEKQLVLESDELDKFLLREDIKDKDELIEIIKANKKSIFKFKEAYESIKNKIKVIGFENIEEVIRNVEAKLKTIWDPKHIALTFGLRASLLYKYGNEFNLNQKSFTNFYTAVKNITDKVNVKDIKLLEAMSNYLEDKGRKQYKTKQAIKGAKYKLERIWGLKKITRKEIEEMTLKK